MQMERQLVADVADLEDVDPDVLEVGGVFDVL
jgi:hypothetical protein